MATTCTNLIANDITNDPCVDDFKKGLEKNAWIFNSVDIDRGTTVISGNKVTELKLSGTKKGYKVQSPYKNAFMGANASSESTDTVPTITKNVPVTIMANTVINGNTEKALMNGEFVMVVETKAKGITTGASATETNAFVVFGLETGLKHSAGEQDFWGDQTGGWAITLTEEGCYEPLMFFDKGGYAATKTALDSLVTGA